MREMKLGKRRQKWGIHLIVSKKKLSIQTIDTSFIVINISCNNDGNHLSEKVNAIGFSGSKNTEYLNSMPFDSGFTQILSF